MFCHRVYSVHIFLSVHCVRWLLLCTSNPRVNCVGGIRVSIELDFAGPLDLSHNNKAKVCYFHFYLVLGCCATPPRSAAGTQRVPSLFTCFYLEKEDKRQPRRAHIATHISTLQDSVGWRRRHIHDDAPGGGRTVVTWRSRERRRVRQQLKSGESAEERVCRWI